MKLAFVLGTRPEIIKMVSLIRECEKQKIPYFIIHTNQHYSKEMDQAIFDDLKIKKPQYNLQVGSGIHGLQTGKMLQRIEEVYLKEKPTVTLVQGDTNTTLAGALAASKMRIKIAHIEAGLRSFDRSMPEEINRVLVDHIADYCFIPTAETKTHLLKEGIDSKKIFLVGNTVVDALFQNLKLAEKKASILKKYNLKPKNYFLITWHRAENTGNKEKINNILKAFNEIYQTYKLPLLFPIHPRTQADFDKFNITIPQGLTLTPPASYLEFLSLMQNAKLILTDSGGLQEEACILKVPCVTLRENTERPETIEVGSNLLVGTEPDKILAGIKKMLEKKTDWINPFGDGKSAGKIIQILYRSASKF